MKWTFIIRQKFKVALLLACIMLLIVVTNLISRKNVGDISDSFNSMYNDRLIPATDIFYLAENLFSKRLILWDYLMSNEENTNDVKKVLARHNYTVDSLVAAFEKTYLVDEELRSLKDFKDNAKKYTRMESRILNQVEEATKADALAVFQGIGKDIFHDTIIDLEKLTKIQTSVGKDLNSASQSDATSITLLSSVQLILVFVIGAVVQALVFASKTLKIKQKQRYRLN